MLSIDGDDSERIRQPENLTFGEPIGSDHTAELCDPGLWRPYNQDTTALARGVSVEGEPFTVMVVCDGVSSSPHSELASSTAARSARDALDHFLRSADVIHETGASAVSTTRASAADAMPHPFNSSNPWNP